MKKLNKEDLENIGIYFTGDKAYPNLFNIPCLGEKNLYLPITIEDILLMCWKAGNEHGINTGMLKKAQEIKKVLCIEDDF